MDETRFCPICKRPVPDEAEAARFRPFCSRRCADIDLGRWLKGSYAIPAAETDGDAAPESDGEPEGERGSHPENRPRRSH
jgi:endogenous inhibitor of DNA gyrase (YacG/DUF329 family)